MQVGQSKGNRWGAKSRWQVRTVAMGFCCGVLGLTACDQPMSNPVTPPDSFRKATIANPVTLDQHGRSSRSIDAEFRRIELSVPGFGGYFLNEEGVLVAYLTDLSKEETLRTTLETLMKTEREHEYNPIADAKGIEIRQGKFSYSQLSDWQADLSQSFGRIEGLSAIDADEAINRVTVEVTNAESQVALQQQASSLEIPEDALTFRVVEKMSERAATLSNAWTPTIGGIQIAEDLGGLCSLGFNQGTTTSGSGRYAITAAHCINDAVGTTGQTGDTFYQPLYSPMAYVDINVPWNYSSPSCGVYSLCTTSDVLRMEYLMTTSTLKVAVANSGSTTVTGTDSIVSVVTPTVGLSLTRIGRSSGSATGNVIATCENRVTNGPVGSLMNLCVDRAGGAISAGDSGGPVTYRLGSNQASMAGIIIALFPSAYLFTNHGQIVATIGTFTPY